MKPRTVKIIKLKKKYAILLIVALLLVFGIVAGVSYAFFTSTVAGKEYVVYSGNLEIAYEKKTDVINLQAAKPMTNTEGLATTPYSFDVKNIGSLTTKYQVRLETDNSNTLPLEYVKVSVYKNDIQYLKPTKLSDLNSTLVIVDNGLLETSASDNYKVRLWVDINTGNDMVGKVFKAKVVIDGMQDVADGFDVNTRPIITLNKLNNETHINLVQGNTFTDPGVESVKDDRDILKKSDITTTYEYYDGTNLTTVNSINTSNTGVYYITYSILDKEGLAGSTIRVVTVNPTETVPTITLNGDSTLELTQLDTYEELGVTVDSEVKVATIGEVKTSVPGTYVVRYIAIDQNGNMNSVTRSILVTYLDTTLYNVILHDNKTTKDVVIPNSELKYKSSEESSEGYQNGLFKAIDTNGGDTYYYRGAVNNNYLQIGNDLWRIVRINEDGTIRIIRNDKITYNGENYFRFNNDVNNIRYIYYTNGTDKSSNYDAYSIINDWYDNAIVNSDDYKNIITTGVYCQAAKIKSNNDYNIGNASSIYMEDYIPSYSCPNNDGNISNGKLILNVGLITIDELLMAGGKAGGTNSTFYLRYDDYYWPMSPDAINNSDPYAWLVANDGNIRSGSVTNLFALRPVINIKSGIRVTGNGIITDPYVVVTE